MKFKPSNVIWGLGFIIIGILLYCKTFLDWDISLWNLVWRFWPIVIILSSFSGLLNKGFNMGSFIWLLIGVVLLLLTNDLVDGDLIRKLLVPAALVLIGISIIFKGAFSGNKNSNSYTDHNYSSSSNVTGNTANEGNFKKGEYNAVFGSTQERYPNEIFLGTCINSVFGSVVLDLRDAVITEDVVINASVIFAGADIYVPSNVNIKVSSIPIFGGVSNKAHTDNTVGGPTIFINATCMFGGLEIK